MHQGQLIHETELDSADPAHGIRSRYRCFRVLVVKGDRWVLIPAAWEAPHGYALMINADSSVRIAFTKHLGIDATAASDWSASSGENGWPCPEVGPH